MVLSTDEMAGVLSSRQLVAPPVLVALLYGAGLQNSKAMALRIEDIEFDRRAIATRQGKGGVVRLILPHSLEVDMRAQMERSRLLGLRDQASCRGGEFMPML